MGLMRVIEGLFFAGGDEEQDANSSELQEKFTVLAIDDDPTFLENMRELLKPAGITVLTSCSGAKGLDVLHYTPQEIRVVLLDYNMPRLNGKETLHYVRKLNPKAKVLAITGMGTEDLPDDFRQGVDRLLQKPFHSADLIMSLRLLAQPEQELAVART